MRKVLSVFIAGCLALSLFIGVFARVPPARADTYGDYRYAVSGGKATIMGYTGSGGAVVIPGTLGGYPVTSIGIGAFFDCVGLTTVTIPNSVTIIGEAAFQRCTKLTSVTIPNSVTSIGGNAFFDCVGLTSVTIPNRVTSIGIAAFGRCTALTSVTIGSGITRIGNSVFAGCTALRSVTIPTSVTTIGNFAFYECMALITVTIPNSVAIIGEGAFQGCTKLTSVTIPNRVTSIGGSAFEGCTALTSVTIPTSVTSIGFYAFNSCTALTSVTIPNSVTRIGDDAFSYCTKLTSVTIGSGVTRVDSYAFGSCPALTAAHFQGNAPTGTTDMFMGCASGFTVWYQNGTTGWTNPWYGYPTAIVKNTTKNQTVMVLQIGKSTFTVNGASKTLDSPPVIKNSRTLVPIRAIIEALAGTVGWDATTKKATVTLGKKTIALWIGKSAATVNGVSTPIDSTNAKVVPEIINGRTMLPLRFVTENLGATVGWDQNTQTITITYTP
jgi:hypothetical protein